MRNEFTVTHRGQVIGTVRYQHGLWIAYNPALRLNLVFTSFQHAAQALKKGVAA